MSFRSATVFAAILVGHASTTFADVIYKTDGGKVAGTLLVDQCDAKTLVVKTRYGVVKFPRSEVARIESSPPEPAESYQDAARRFSDTADEQFDLAEWCKDHGYSKEAAKHYRRTIELYPDHAEARKRLGYRKVGDRWMTRDEVLEEKGLVKHKGKYVLPQEQARDQELAAEQEIRQEYHRKIKLWQRWLSDPKADRRELGEKYLRGVKDRLAVKPLADLLGERGGDADQRLLVDVLGGVKGSESTQALVKLAFQDVKPGVRQAAARELKKRKSPELVKQIAGFLHDDENRKVNAAGEILGEIGDDSAAPALAAALVTRHKYTLPPLDLNELAYGTFRQVMPSSATAPLLSVTATDRESGLPIGIASPEALARRYGYVPFAAGRGGPLVMMSAGPRVVVQNERNPAVLNALKKLTNEDFGYDRTRWLEWMRTKGTKAAAPATGGL